MSEISLVTRPGVIIRDMDNAPLSCNDCEFLCIEDDTGTMFEDKGTRIHKMFCDLSLKPIGDPSRRQSFCRLKPVQVFVRIDTFSDKSVDG